MPWPGKAASPWISTGTTAAGSCASSRALRVGLVGARAALDHRVHELEVARVGRERDRDAAPRPWSRRCRWRRSGTSRRRCRPRARRSRPRASARPRTRRGSRRRGGRPCGQHVQPAAVRHAEHHLARAGRGGQLDRLVEHRHDRVEALDRELLLAEEGLVQVVLERLDLGQPLEQRRARRRRAAGGRCRTRSACAARRAARGPRCARSRRRSCPCRSRAGSAARRRRCRPARPRAGPTPGCGASAPR